MMRALITLIFVMLAQAQAPLSKVRLKASAR